MARNISKQNHPIQFQIARLKRRSALNAEKIQLIGKGLIMISLPFAMMYAARGITKYQQAQEKNREAAMHRFEEMPAEQRDKIWKKDQQEALFKYIKNARGIEK